MMACATAGGGVYFVPDTIDRKKKAVKRAKPFSFNIFKKDKEKKPFKSAFSKGVEDQNKQRHFAKRAAQ